jgi:hypothetical protein
LSVVDTFEGAAGPAAPSRPTLSETGPGVGACVVVNWNAGVLPVPSKTLSEGRPPCRPTLTLADLHDVTGPEVAELREHSASPRLPDTVRRVRTRSRP